MKHILRSQDFDRALIEELFDKASQFSMDRPWNKLRGRIMCSLFYEPSTRTRLSFESAHLRLGGAVMGTENAGEFSSAIKGETLEDSIRVISSYSDVIVLRHSDNDAAERAAAVSSCPIINAGNGTGQHPTQSLTDLYTIQQRMQQLDDLHVAIVGDLRHGRTARSLAYLLAKFDGIRITFVAPPELQIAQDILDHLDKHDVQHDQAAGLMDVIGEVDVIYQTRLQRERHGRENHQHGLDIDLGKASLMKPNSIILHPLPRNDEITLEVDSLPQAAYFQQAANSLYVRMALLDHLI